jgi:hypothetical protein
MVKAVFGEDQVRAVVRKEAFVVIEDDPVSGRMVLEGALDLAISNTSQLG